MHHIRRLVVDFPELQIVGTDAPRVDRNGNLDAIAKRIRDARAEIVLVALGAPFTADGAADGQGGTGHPPGRLTRARR